MSDTENTPGGSGEGEAQRPNFTIDTGTDNDYMAHQAADGSFSSETVEGAFRPGEKTIKSAEELEAELEGIEEEDSPEGEASKTEDGEEVKEEEGDKPEHSAIDLPTYDPANEEVSKQYADKYTLEDGAAINFEAFNESFYANLAKGLVDIHPDERAFIKDKFKISDGAVDSYLKGVAAQVQEHREAQDNAVYSTYGSKEGFEAAIAWATGDGGYTKAQKDRYNAALEAADKGDTSLLEEQVELLKNRFNASGKAPAPKEDPKPVQKTRRASSPSASATAGAGVSQAGPAPFSTYAEFTQAQAIAHNSGDRAAMKEVQERLKASPKLWRGMGG